MPSNPTPRFARSLGGGWRFLRAQEGDEGALDHIATPDGRVVGGPSTEPINAQLPAALDSRTPAAHQS